MQHLVPLNSETVHSLLKIRPRESKFGENIKILSPHPNIYDQINDLDVKYVLFGIEEDIGVRANFGKVGTAKAWESTLKVLLNIQSNQFLPGDKVLILGKLSFPEYDEELRNWEDNPKKQTKKARKFVAKIDKEVTAIVHAIVNSGKIPIAVGGGHNNSYGMIKGTALSLNKRINCINLDAHSDFRPEEGRHSGNGFSYAYGEGFLKKYFIFGLHENYTSDTIFKSLMKFKNVDYVTFEEIMIKEKYDFSSRINHGLKFMDESPFGLEIDCDSIKDVSSSAMTPTGFEVEQARSFISSLAGDKNCQYLHICEAAPNDSNENQIGKLLSYLVTDFIKAHES